MMENFGGRFCGGYAMEGAVVYVGVFWGWAIGRFQVAWGMDIGRWSFNFGGSI
jgi:hypothetical protein